MNPSLSEEIESLLNQQMAAEARASANYLAMASWCDRCGYRYAAKFLYKHAEEERSHMMKIFHYINDMGGQAIHPAIEQPKTIFSSFRNVFELVFSHEVDVTKQIHNLVDRCLATKDFATFNFMQWFVQEQIEEENLARRALELFGVVEGDGVGHHMIHNALNNLELN